MKIPAWVVTDVTPHDNYTLTITFANGAVKLYDASPLLDKKAMFCKVDNINVIKLGENAKSRPL